MGLRTILGLKKKKRPSPDPSKILQAISYKLPVAPLSERVGDVRVSVVCHLFYVELADELRFYLENIPIPFRLVLTTDTEQKRTQIQTVFRQADIRVVPNIGRDIAAKLLHCRDVFETSDLVLCLHGKKSPQANDLSKWREHLFNSLLGTRQRVVSILNAFAETEAMGMISPVHHRPVRAHINWGANEELARQLLSRMTPEARVVEALDFPSGSMFWARTGALRPLLDLDLTLDDFPPESGQVDGTIAHAVERLFFVSCEIAGLKWMKISSDTGAESIAPFEISDVETLKGLLNSDHWPTTLKSGQPIS